MGDLWGPTGGLEWAKNCRLGAISSKISGSSTRCDRLTVGNSVTHALKDRQISVPGNGLWRNVSPLVSFYGPEMWRAPYRTDLVQICQHILPTNFFRRSRPE